MQTVVLLKKIIDGMFVCVHATDTLFEVISILYLLSPASLITNVLLYNHSKVFPVAHSGITLEKSHGLTERCLTV